MKEKSVKMYLKEYTSKLEFWNNKKMISVHNKIKNQKLKKIYNKILSLYINVNFILNVWKSSVKVEKNKNNTIVCTIIIKNNINNNWERYLYKRCIRQCRLEQAGYCGSQYQCKLLYAGIFLGSSGDRNGCGTFGA